jgi:hypothetical protein
MCKKVQMVDGFSALSKIEDKIQLKHQSKKSMSSGTDD